MYKLSVDGLHKRYGDNEVLKGVSLKAKTGDVICLIGASGSGKSTFLRCINFLETPNDGAISLDGKLIRMISDKNGMRVADDAELQRLRTRLAMVFQHFNLWSHMTVLENITLAPHRVLGVSKKDAEERARRYLDKVGLPSRVADQYPAFLSGGQQQRVAIARALMMEPQVLLFDEPTAALDPEITAQIVSIIRELAETNITQVIVTHEVEVARKTASRVVYMENGHIVEQGDASCFTEPQTEAFKNYLSH